MFGALDRVNDLEELLSDAEHDVESLVTGLVEILELPELMEQGACSAGVFCRIEDSIVRLASAMAGPTWLIEAGGGWRVAQSADGGDEADFANAELAAAISAAGPRRDRALLLWRDGDAAGFTVWRRGSVEAGHSWNSRWRGLEDDELALVRETACVTGLAAVAGEDLHLPSLRALLRRSDHAGDPLAALAHLLGIPQSSLAVLDQSGRPREGLGAELVKRSSSIAAWWAAVRHRTPQPIRRSLRPFYVAYTVGTVLAALVTSALTVLGIGILATGGSLIDEPSITFEDWKQTGLLALLSVVLIPTAVFRIRRLRATDDSELEEGSLPVARPSSEE